MFTVYLKLLFTAIFWGGTFIAARVLSQHMAPFSAAFFRFVTASVFLFMLTLKTEGKLPAISKRQILPLFLLGLTGVFAYNFLFFSGLKEIAAGRASLIIATNPVFIALFAALIFKEKLSALKFAGIVLSVSGAAVVISRGDLMSIFRGGLGWGELFIFGCVASWVSYSLIAKTILTSLTPIVAVTYSSAIGTFLLFIPAYFEGLFANLGRYAILDWLSIFYLGFFGTVLAFIWYHEGIKRIGPTRAGQFINFVPLSAIVLALFILNEPITLFLLIGACLVISGVYLTNIPPRNNAGPLVAACVKPTCPDSD